MRALNKVQLIGNLGADPEIRYTAAGDAVATLRIATTEAWTDKGTGERKEQTEWHRCVLWRRLAEIAGEYLSKGARVYIEGKLQTRKWQDQSGQDRYTTEVQVRDLIMLDGRGDGQGQPREASRQHGPGRGNGAAERAASFQEQAPPPTYDQGGEFEDDIPF
jgi:single-strand DNA-binding protein